MGDILKEGEEATEGEEVVVKGAEGNIYIEGLVGMKEEDREDLVGVECGGVKEMVEIAA